MNIRIFDAPELIGRYTVVWLDTGIALIMSENPQDYCQHGMVSLFRVEKEPSYLGKEIPFNDLPKECQRVIEQEEKKNNGL